MSSDGPARTLLLGRCARCASDLVQAVEVVHETDHVLVGRRCPECGHGDLVEADADVVHAWLLRQARIRAELGRTADRIARAPRIELLP